ncbi:acetyl-CoA carboxylase biotin carboxyl carrier protein [Bacillus timonensis]|nr:acetyl-CoA carboxylase biotin carboxyl carrier protein [Bacillus timonensis]
MLKVQEIRELIKLIDQSNIDEFVFEQDGAKIKMKKHNDSHVQTVVREAVQEAPKVVSQPTEAPVAAVATQTQQDTKVTEDKSKAMAENLHKITSPMVGTFYSSSSPEADPYVKVGDKVKADSVVCIVEAMKLFNEIEAEVNGEIVEILVENGQLVEYGQPLFLVKA